MLKGYVEIEKLRLYGHHGVMAQERTVGNMFEVTAGLWYDMRQAAVTDDVAFALDYSRVVSVIERVMEKPSALLENVALRMKEALEMEFPLVLGGSVRIAKITPPVAARMASASVTLEW